MCVKGVRGGGVGRREATGVSVRIWKVLQDSWGFMAK